MRSLNLHIVTIVILLCSIVQPSVEVRNTKKEPIILDENSWTQILQGEWMVDFYAPWCPACQKLEPEWRKFAEWSDDLNIDVASADVTANPGLTGRFMISGLPTIYHVKDGVFRLYTGTRDHSNLINFIEEQNWKTIEPVSRWWSPATLQMSLLAYSFRISMTLRDVHNYLVEDVGLPYYISYLLFALCTVTLGTLLGLLIVFIIDQFCPARAVNPTPQVKKSVAKKKKTDKSRDSDLEDSDATTKTRKPTASESLRKRG